MIRTIVATWQTPYSEELWQQIRDKGTSTEDGLWSLGPALPDDEEPRLAEVVIGDGIDGGESDGLLWNLVVHKAPSGQAPDRIVERNERLGGRQGLAKLLVEGFPARTPQVALFHVKLRLDASDYDCSVLPQALQPGGGHESALSLASKANLEQVGYRFEDGVSGIKEATLIYLHEENAYSVTILAKGLLKLRSATWLPYADEIADLIVTTFFVHRESGT